MSFRKDFIIIFLEEKFEFKRNYLKKTGASQWCDWAGALEKMGRGTESVQKERRDKKSKIYIYID
jgi:hypothetical protein